MIREDLDKDSRLANIDIFPARWRWAPVRSKAKRCGPRWSWVPKCLGIQLKPVRKGTLIERYFACGGSDWDKLDTVEYEDLPADVYAGLFSTSHDNTTLATAEFRDIKIESN